MIAQLVVTSRSRPPHRGGREREGRRGALRGVGCWRSIIALHRDKLGAGANDSRHGIIGDLFFDRSFTRAIKPPPTEARARADAHRGAHREPSRHRRTAINTERPSAFPVTANLL